MIGSNEQPTTASSPYIKISCILPCTLLQITMNVKKLDKVAVPRDVETQLVVLTASVVQGLASMQMDRHVMVGCL